MKTINSQDQTRKEAGVHKAGEETSLRADVAIGTLVTIAAILVLYFTDLLIFHFYDPDVATQLEHTLSQSFLPAQWFLPEPVERTMFYVTVFLLPFVICGVYFITKKIRPFFLNRPVVVAAVNYSGIGLLVLWLMVVFSETLPHIPSATNAFFFRNNLLSVLTPFVAITVYCVAGYFLFRFYRRPESQIVKQLLLVTSIVLVVVLLGDLVLYNLFNIEKESINVTGETNPVFYSITQVYAGKSLLVNINCQYGLYAWFLNPLFKLIGLSSYKIGLIMALLNATAYLFLYLGIRRIIRENILSLLVFMCLIFWQYWQLKLPLGEEARFYYQYWPVRLFFPSVSFYLIGAYVTGEEYLRKRLLPILALVSSAAILWNADVGLVVFGAVVTTLIFQSFYENNLRKAISQSFVYLGWMLGALAAIVAFFYISTRIHSGHWPDFSGLFEYQKMFYISGFFMLPTVPVHFWNLPAIMYVIAGVYCLSKFSGRSQKEVPVILFLFVLGVGLFAYFQGRSYDTTIDMVMWPAIIVTGFLCRELFQVLVKARIAFTELTLMLIIVFVFIADGALSMLYYIPSTHSFSWNNATYEDEDLKQDLARRMNFIRSNFKDGDTVLILSRNYEAFYYAAGHYYNPVNLASSTEIMLNGEVDTLLNCIKTTKYPIVADAQYIWLLQDSIASVLAKYTTIQKKLDDVYEMLILAHRAEPRKNHLAADANTLIYRNQGSFIRIIQQRTPLDIPDEFSIDLYCLLDTQKLQKDNIMFCTPSQNAPFTGFLMKQTGDDLTQYKFCYGNGTEWCKGVMCKLSCRAENHLIITVQRDALTIVNNGALCGTANTGSSIKNNQSVFYINPAFSGIVNELKISRP